MNCTSIEQSEMLLKLGLNPKSADMLYPYDHIREVLIATPKVAKLPDNWSDEDRVIPCWSTDALINMMPKINNSYPIFGRSGNDGTYHIIYGTYNIYNQKTLMDAVYNMIIFLLMKDLIKQ